MIRISHQNRYIQTTTEQKECIDCGGTGWIYEFYNDPVSWRTCPRCNDEKDK